MVDFTATSSDERNRLIFAESRVAISSSITPESFFRLSLVSSSKGLARRPPSIAPSSLGISSHKGERRTPTSKSPSGACSTKSSMGDQSFTWSNSSGAFVARVQPSRSISASLRVSACLRMGLSSVSFIASVKVTSSPPNSSKTKRPMGASASIEARLGSPNAIPAIIGSIAT